MHTGGVWVIWGSSECGSWRPVRIRGAVSQVGVGLICHQGAWVPYPARFRMPAPGWSARGAHANGLSLQVILCTKEVSVGARKNAFVLLVEMGHAFLRFGPSQEGEAQVTWG